MDGRISFREIREQDEPLLFVFYASTRTDVHATDLSDKKKDEFLRMQFKAQSTHYHSHFPDASFQIVLFDDVPVGRLYVDRNAGMTKVLDIIVLPEYRGQGIGRWLIKRVLDEARELSKCVRLHVDAGNPIIEQWYRRLGFEELDRTQVYIHMEWCPEKKVTL